MLAQSQWQFQLDSTPRGESHVIDSGGQGQVLLIPLGSTGLGAWTGGGTPLPGFPVAGEAGVILRPAAVTMASQTYIAFADNSVRVHLIDLNGTESPGWPVENSCNVVTGITVTDLNDDGEPEISFGTGDGNVQMLDSRGRTLPGFPVNLDSRLQCQPTQVSLGGGRGFGLVCTTNNGKITVLHHDGSVLPGWPVQLSFPAGTTPVSGDVNGDGQADLIFASQDGKIHLLNLLGEEQDGWPFHMAARPVAGAPAMGMLDPDQGTPQIAIASVDSLVYLLNGDGTLAGSWRWPNKTDSRPYQPIISLTEQGPAVVASSSNGTLYAWDRNGRRMDGFPVEYPAGTIFAPVAADLNGDGQIELISVTPSGLVRAVELSSGQSIHCNWPQALGDQYNTGSFGTGSLPVATVEQVSGEFSGPVSIQYSISCSDYSGISVSYSTDTGYTWHETENYTDTGSSVTWNTHLDLPDMDIRNCILRITPVSVLGLGESGTSDLLHIDNNDPPVIRLESPVKLDDDTYRLGYALQDKEGDIVHLQAQYSTDGGNTWNLMHLSGSSVEIESWFYGEPVIWNTSEDLGETPPENVNFRIRASDADPGPWFRFDGLAVSSSSLPTPQIIVPSVETAGDVEFGVRLTNPDQDPMNFIYQYSIDQGTRWHEATVSNCELVRAGNYDYNITWNSSEDLPSFDGDTVELRALPPLGGTGVSVPSTGFHLDNNKPPYCSISSPERYDLFRGLVPVDFTVVDSEWDEIHLDLQYRLHERNDTWHSAAGLMNSSIIDASRYSTTLRWNSSVDLPETPRVEIDIRLLAADRDSAYSQEIGPITLSNSNLPEVVSTSVSEISTLRRIAEISFEVADDENRSLTLAVDYSINGGKTWEPASLSGSTTGLVPGNYIGSFTWRYGQDDVANEEEAILRLTPLFDVTKPGKPRFIQQVFR